MGSVANNVRLTVEEGEGEEGNPTDAVLFVGISLVLGIASRHLLRGTRVPYTVALLVLGIAMGSLGTNLLIISSLNTPYISHLVVNHV